MIYIYTNTREAAHACARQFNLRIDEWAFISDVSQIRDKLHLRVWLYGSFAQRFDYREATRIFDKQQAEVRIVAKRDRPEPGDYAV